MSKTADKGLVWRMMASLGCITVIAAALMAWVNHLTAPVIAQAAEQTRVEAVTAVTDGIAFDNNPVAESREMAGDHEGDEPTVLYPLVLKGRFAGAAVESYSMEGFDGLVKVMYGFDADGTVTGFEVLRQTETPGLGAKMQDWFRDPAASRSVIGRNAATTKFRVTKDGGDIDAITAATISSRAFLDALRRANRALNTYKSQTTTSPDDDESAEDNI